MLGSGPRLLIQVVEWSPRVYICNKFRGDADAGLRMTVWGPLVWGEVTVFRVRVTSNQITAVELHTLRKSSGFII